MIVFVPRSSGTPEATQLAVPSADPPAPVEVCHVTRATGPFEIPARDNVALEVTLTIPEGVRIERESGCVLDTVPLETAVRVTDAVAEALPELAS